MTTKRVFANFIIECFRIGAWSELSQGCLLETVHEVERESLTGENSQANWVLIDPVALRAGFQKIHPVSREKRNALIFADSRMTTLDRGERDLFAHLYTHARNLEPSRLAFQNQRWRLSGPNTGQPFLLKYAPRSSWESSHNLS
jgi:hypothetical protein